MSSDIASPDSRAAAIDPDAFRMAMRRVSSPVAIVTSMDGDQPVGLTATAICSATTEPPTILVCVNQTAGAVRPIAASRVLAVSFLSEAQHGIARIFSTGGVPAAERFASCAWGRAVTGAPLLRDAVATFDCEVDAIIPSGSHNIYVSRVVDAAFTEAGALLYRDGFFRRLDEKF